MKTHRMLIITSVVLVTLLITTGVALAHAGAVYNTAEGDFSTVSGGRNNNISDPDSLVTTQEDNKFPQGVRIPNIPSGTQASGAVPRDLEATAGQPPPLPSKPQLQLPVTADAGPDQTVPGPSPVEVQFDGSGSTGDIISYRWINQFGGVRAEEVSPTFEVDFGQDPQPGATRTFTLEVADAEGNTDTDTVTITLAAPPPVTADARPDHTLPGPSPVEVQFDGSGSTGDIISYKWINQFGQVRAEEVSPTFEVNFGQNPQPGTTRTFTLEVADAEGNTDTDTVTITLAAPPPPPPQGEFPLDLVVFNNTQANFFLNNPQWVHPGDTFMIVSANAFSGDNEDYNPSFVNNTARRLLNRFPQTEVLATTSGRRNTRTAINTVDRNLINIVMTVWEPNNPDFPTDA